MPRSASPEAALSYAAFDALVTLVAVVDSQGRVVFANAALQDTLGVSHKALVGSTFSAVFTEPEPLHNALHGPRKNTFSTLRFEAWLRRASHEPMPVHVIVTHVEHSESAQETIVEMVPLEQQTRQEREERLTEQARDHKALIRNLAHEIKNPLGGIRGSAQLLEMELATPALTQYTQVIIREADRLQSLVDRLLEPHRSPHQVGDVNIHEVCERVRSLIVAEFPQGLRVLRDYDISIPEFRGDREHLIQAVLNIAHNAAQALAERIAAGDAVLTLRSRVTRQITFAKQRYRLALELHIIDNGPGIAEAIKDRIFQPLVSGREGGSGLGLTLAQTYVQQHQGLIEVESSPGRTDFKILIPLP